MFILTLYLHGMSGYTMSFHKCMITGFENVYTGFGVEDPCGEEDADCSETQTHFEQAECCDIDQAIISVDDDSNISTYKIPLASLYFVQILFPSYEVSTLTLSHAYYCINEVIPPPDLSRICVFRI